jgi:hypothetical protein
MKHSKRGVLISDDMKAFVESGVSVVIGTRDMGLVPEIVRGWGPTVSKDRQSISLCVARSAAARTLDNLSTIGRIAVGFTLPTNLHSVQLKGTWIETTDVRAADMTAVERHREAFAALNQRVGIPRMAIEAFWKRELESSAVMVKVRFLPEQIFNQTPGPGAGSRL